MVRPPKKRFYEFKDEPERQTGPSQENASGQETPQQADSNVEDVTTLTPQKDISLTAEEEEEEEEESEMKNPKMSSSDANETSTADSSLQEDAASTAGGENQSLTPTKSRFGRSHKPKMLGDFVSTDKKVSIVLKVSPVNQFKYYKDSSRNAPNKIRHERRGRPRKSLLRDSFGTGGSQKTPQSPPKGSQKTPQSPPKTGGSQKTPQKTPQSPRKTAVVQIEPMPVTTSSSLTVKEVEEVDDVKVDPEEMEPDPGCEWMVGDLAWARIGNHPFWPCIIARDPELGIFTRIRMFTKSLVPHRRLHVQFFGDNGRRSWLSSTSVMNYTGRAAFEELSQSILSAMKRKDPRQVSALVVKPNLKSVWESAVNEAESLLHSSREERVLHFKRLVRKNAISQKLTTEINGEGSQLAPQRVKRQYRKRKAENSQGDPEYVVAKKQIKLDIEALTGQSSTPPVLTPRKRGRPRKSLTPSANDTLIKQEPTATSSPRLRPGRPCKSVIKMDVDELESSALPDSEQAEASLADKSVDVALESDEQPKKKFRTPTARSSEQMGKVKNKKAKLGAEFNKFSSKQFNKISSEHPEMGAKEVEVRLEKMWKDLDDAQKSKYRIKLNCKDKDDEEEEESVTWDPEDTDEKTSTSEISESPLTLPNPPPRSRTKAKVSIFNGAFQGKVCQVCEKPGNTFRCKGPCFGTYHLECAANPRDFSARINEIFQSASVSSSSSSNSPVPFGSRKKKVDGRGRRKSSSLVQKEGGEGVEEEKKKEEKDDGRRKVADESEEVEEEEEKKEKVDGRRKKKSLVAEESEDVEETTSEKKIDERTKTKTESEDSEAVKEDPLIEGKKEKIEGRRRKSLVKTDSEDVEETTAVKEEKIDRRRKKSLVKTEDVVEEDEKKEKIDGRRRKSQVKTESSEDSNEDTNEGGKKEDGEGGEKGVVADESTTDSDVKGGTVDKKKGGRKGEGGSKESCDSSEEVDSQSADFRCAACTEGRLQACFVCGREEFNGESSRQRCHVAYCGRVYHLECLKAWPQVNWIRSAGSIRGGGGGGASGKGMPVFACPQHACHTCISDNPSVMKERFANDRLVKCLRCPTSYHYGNHCLPAGTEIIAARQIICPQHYKKHKKGLQHVNAAWCFICASGGSLICCDMCPTAFHADCLKISPPEGGYICEDCETGRFPLYGEIVWVKLGVYRWWPAQVMFPHLIPPNIRNLAHARGEFAVKFFGSHDFYWVNRGRVFLYQEGDSGGRVSSRRKGTDQMFLRAVEEASVACMRLKNEKASRDATHRSAMKPPSYIRIKTNKPVGQVRAMEANISSLTPCECDPNSANPCALDTDCLNRILMIECNPLICPAGQSCKNQQFEKREYPPLMPYRTDGRGWGLKTLVDLKKGEFVIEYVGEMINEVEYQRRLQKMHESNENNYYFLTIDKDRMLDAGPKGNVARFMNHSCQPNCETQKWTVNGDTRVGLFALHDIAAETELVFNYNLESIGTEKKQCMCGAPNCSGFIGVKASKNGNGIHTDDSVQEKQKKPRRRSRSSKPPPAKLSDDICFICDQGGELLLCDGKHCTKAYHLNCLSRNKKHPVGYWLCPWHQCNVCCKGKVYRCNFCINSYCPTHAEGNIRREESIGYVCTKHGCTKGDKSKTDDKSKPAAALAESSTSPKAEESATQSSDDKVPTATPTTTPTTDVDVALPPLEVPSESTSSSNATSSENVESAQFNVKALSCSPRTRRARSNSDVNQTAMSAAKKGDESGVKLLRRIRRPASVDSLTISKETEVPLKENLLRSAVLKRRRSLKSSNTQEEKNESDIHSVDSATDSKQNAKPKETVQHDEGGGGAPSANNCDVGESNCVDNAQLNGHVDNDDLLKSEKDNSSKISESNLTNRESEKEKVVDENEKVTSNRGEEVSNVGEDEKVGVVSEMNGEITEENEEENKEEESKKSNSQEKNLEVDESKVDEGMECESASSAENNKVDDDKTETIVKSNSLNCDLDMECTDETPKDLHDEDEEEEEKLPNDASCNEKSTKDEEVGLTKDGGGDKNSLSKETDEKSSQQVKVNGLLDEWSDEEVANDNDKTTDKNNSSDKETSEKDLVDNCKTRLDTVGDCNTETNGDANISENKDECALKKSANSKQHISTDDSLVT